jgi:colanic acid biosynthesis glycosyl transferase WcaI
MLQEGFKSHLQHPMIDRRKIWFVNRFFYPDHSATSQILSDLAFHLAARGQEIGIITSLGVYDDPLADLPAFETIGDVAVHRVGRSRFGRQKLLGRAVDYVWLYGAFAAAAAQLAKRGDWIVVKTDPPLLSAAIAPVARAKGLRLINWLQDLYPEVALGLGMNALAPIAPLLVAARDASLRIAACNVAIGDSMRERLLQSGVPPHRVAVIPNWCNDAAIRPLNPADNPLREAWGLEDKFVVGYSGNLGRAHEYQTLLDAAERLRTQFEIIFLFIGGWALSAGLKSEVERRGLSNAFRFLPYQDESLLPQSLALPDIHWISLRPEMEGLIVPSKFYGIAAAARATIAVAAPDGEIGALVARYDCGHAVAPGDGSGLAELIQRLAGDPERRARMGANARAMLDGAFSRKFCLESWEGLFAKQPESTAGNSPAT